MLYVPGEEKKQEKWCYMLINRIHAPLTRMEECSVVPPIFWDKKKDSKTNCSAASISPIQLIKLYLAHQVCAWLQYCLAPSLLSCVISLKLRCSSAGLTLDMWAFTFTSVYNNSWTRSLGPKTPHGRLDKVKIVTVITARLYQSLPALLVLILNGSLMQRG